MTMVRTKKRLQVRNKRLQMSPRLLRASESMRDKKMMKVRVRIAPDTQGFHPRKSLRIAILTVTLEAISLADREP